MSKTVLIDSAYGEEVRIAVVSNGKLEKFFCGTQEKKPLKGNIYLSKVTNIEPSLHAVFVEYGEIKKGFLVIDQIHHSYFNKSDEEFELSFDNNLRKKSRIQSLISKNQALVVQVIKEEFGNKCAALTTFLSIQGRYAALMPFSDKGVLIDKSISDNEKSQIRKAIEKINIPSSIGLHIKCSASITEINNEIEYLMRSWQKIKELAQAAKEPCLLWTEDNHTKRILKNINFDSVKEVIVEGTSEYDEIYDFLASIAPGKFSISIHDRNQFRPIFTHYGIEDQICEIHTPFVRLPSGGSIVITPTEALTTIDVNSGALKTTANMTGTAFKTNLEAVSEIARQIRLRDIGGLVIVDFIDMKEYKHISVIEKNMKDALLKDSPLIQIAKISEFGVLQFSRPKGQPSMNTRLISCKYCNGIGKEKDIQYASIDILRAIEVELYNLKTGVMHVQLSPEVCQYALNFKRTHLLELESKFACQLVLSPNAELKGSEHRVLMDKDNKDDQTKDDQKYNISKASVQEAVNKLLNNFITDIEGTLRSSIEVVSPRKEQRTHKHIAESISSASILHTAISNSIDKLSETISAESADEVFESDAKESSDPNHESGDDTSEKEADNNDVIENVRDSVENSTTEQNEHTGRRKPRSYRRPYIDKRKNPGLHNGTDVATNSIQEASPAESVQENISQDSESIDNPITKPRARRVRKVYTNDN